MLTKSRYSATYCNHLVLKKMTCLSLDGVSVNITKPVPDLQEIIKESRVSNLKKKTL